MIKFLWRKACIYEIKAVLLPRFFYKLHTIMKKSIILLPLLALLISCSSKKDEPKETYDVKFSVSGFTFTTSPMSAPRKAVSSLSDEDGDMTDLYLFDGSTQLAHQVSTDENFGTITVMLTAGSHTLHFVATRSTGLAYEGGVLSATSLRSTFGKTITINVSGSSDETVEMNRLSGKLVITINDAIPAGATNLRIQVGNIYKSLDVQTLYGVSPVAFDQTVSLSSKVGLTSQTWTLTTLAPDADGYETTFTLTATNGSGAVIGQATGTVTLAPNTKTLLSGNLFTGTRSFVSLNTAWNADINVNF